MNIREMISMSDLEMKYPQNLREVWGIILKSWVTGVTGMEWFELFLVCNIM